MAGIYIHIPFCRQACHYCDFHFSTNYRLQNDFITALLKEIVLQRPYLQGETVETIYFGGGTPSLLASSAIREIMNSIFTDFSIGSDPEITLEANPDDIDPLHLKEWKDAGINRLSIGVQSFFKEDLLWMNRVHDENQAILAIEHVKDAGFDNYSLDLIYGIPGVSEEKWGKNLHKAISFQSPHISCYALTVEPRTTLFKMIKTNKTADIESERQAEQFLTGVRTLEEAGYEHYEISSFAKPGKRSRHNSSYWQSKKYLGLGPSAHSFNGHSRQWNISNNAHYITSLMGGVLNCQSESLRPTDLLNEYIMTSLRTLEGLDLQYVANQFGKEKVHVIENKASAPIHSKQMEKKYQRLVLTKNGKLFADGIASALFFE